MRVRAKYLRRKGFSMDSFNEYLGYFLTECRNNALEELRSDKRYIEKKQAQADIRSKLEAIISPEAKALLEDYDISALTINGLEFNRVMLCGLSLTAEVCKRFDISTPQYKAFADGYLN
jgi:hypothetical protein